MLRLRGPACEDCGCKSGRLELHHLTYDRLGHEWPSDLKILCVRCHARADREREERERKRRIEAAFGTWFEKKTGRPASCATEDDYADFRYWLEWKELEPF
jgi:5-methylcytosine-specific restriction endonuclease McrA